MRQRCRLGALQGRPDLRRKDSLDFRQRGHRHEQSLGEAKTNGAVLRDEFESQNIRVIRANLAVPNHAITGKLEPGYAIVYKLHEIADRRTMKL
jgi:hypothetical protein